MLSYTAVATALLCTGLFIWQRLTFFPATENEEGAGSTNASPQSVSCPSALDCYYIGQTATTESSQIYSTTDGGQTWSGANYGIGGFESNEISGLSAISCPTATTCYASGGYWTSSSYIPPSYVYETTDGLNWSAVSGVPQIGNLDALSCPSATECVAGLGYTAFYVSEWPGEFAVDLSGTWTDVNVGGHYGTAYGSVLAVSCPSTTECLAVTYSGYVLYASVSEPSDLTDPSNWSVLSTGYLPINDIACVSTSSCIAVGGYGAWGPGDQASTDNGFVLDLSISGGTASYSLDSSSTFSSVVALASVACPAVSDCVIAGDSGHIYQQSSSGWTDNTPPGGPASTTPVACSGEYDCYAFGVGEGTESNPYGGLAVLTNSGVSPVDGAPLNKDANAGGSQFESSCTCYFPPNSGGKKPVAEPIDPRVGDFYETTTDVTVPGAGIPLQFTRTYDSQVAQEQASADTPGPLGYGWSDNFGMSLSYDSSAGVATVTEANGAQVGFDADSVGSMAPWCPSSGSENFCADAPRVLAELNHNSDSTWTLTAEVSGTTTYTFSSSGTLTEIEDDSGNTLTESSGTPGTANCPSSASSCQVWTSSGSGLTLTEAFDSSGRLTEVTDSGGTAGTAGTATFCYNGEGCAVGAGSAVCGESSAPGGGSEDL